MELYNIIEICIAIDIAILGIAYPIIVDKISNIGDKYKSQYIPVIFDYEFPHNKVGITISKKRFYISIFKLILYTTLISFLFLIFKIPPPFGWNNPFINNSANIIVFILSTILTILFFIWLDKVVLYNGKSTKILMRLTKQYNNNTTNDEKKQYLLKAINEMAFYSIEQQDDHLQKTLLELYYSVFASIRRKHDKSQPLVYPIDLYFLVSKLNQVVIENNNKKLKALEHRAVSGIWLLGEDFENIIISEETYSWLWNNINTICDNPRLVKMFWANSYQYFDYKLQPIFAEYKTNNEGDIEISNKKENEFRETERKRFLEFHYALGGLILYKNHYKLLKYIFEYSQSEPPKYVLLPETMTEIFTWFEHFRNDFKNLDNPIDFKYYFPGLDNLGNRRQVNYWICSYISILFIRQYSLQQYYIYQNFTSQPILPDDVIELNNWLDSVSYFEKCLDDILQNKQLISDLNFETIVEEHRDTFKDFISTLTTNIKNKIGEVKLQAPISEKKINQFYKQSNIIITDAFKAYDKIFIDENIENSDLKLLVNGATTLMSKSAFTEGDVPHLNYDTIFAESIANYKIKRLIPNSFLIARTKNYVFNKDNILEALDKIVNDNDDILIITTNLDYQLHKLLKESSFEHFITDIPSTEPSILNTLYVLRKSDLPSIEHKDLTEEEKKKFKFDQPINDELKLYASVIDINKEENKYLKDEWKIENEPESFDLKVLLAISFISVIHWKKDREVIQIKISTEYNELGIQNEINDIKPMTKKE